MITMMVKLLAKISWELVLVGILKAAKSIIEKFWLDQQDFLSLKVKYFIQWVHAGSLTLGRKWASENKIKIDDIVINDLIEICEKLEEQHGFEAHSLGKIG